MPKGFILTVVPASLELVLASHSLHCSSAVQAVQAILQMGVFAVLPDHPSMMQNVFLAVLMSMIMLLCPLVHGLHPVLLLAAG
jgi:hypothetical protein